MRSYEYRHVVSFQETNLTGNVYFVSHVSWQGRCREMFLREHCPDVIERLGRDLCLITGRCSCEYLAELSAFDEIVVRMRLIGISQNRLTLGFEYGRVTPAGETLAARGEQEIIIMRRDGEQLVPEAIPESLREALRPYQPS